MRRQIGLSLAVGMLALALAGCSSQPQTILADDDALCRYSAAAADPRLSEDQLYARCRSRIEQQRASVVASNATAIEGYALVRPATDVADPCAAPGAPKDCKPDDATGSIKRAPKPQ